MTLLERLVTWQQQQAAREGVEPFRVLPYKTLVELSHAVPRNEQELLGIKGIGAIKVRRYGAALLALLNDENMTSPMRATRTCDDIQTVPLESVAHNAETGEVLASPEETTFSVGDFLGALNMLMAAHFQHVRVRGEVVDYRRNHTGHAYFHIKDATGVMRVTVFRNAYELSGVELADGMEVIVTGRPQHHAQYGFSFIGETVELAGEGALKKAYDALKEKCAKEGLFAPERKRPIPDFATRIGLITSRDGAAIGDFMTNLGAHGLHIRFVHSAVEGQHAIHELIGAIRMMHALAQRGDIDVLVVTRGGGSLESLQAFNNEKIVRALATFPVPVIAGIGHERDETLTTLVADVGVSTPTAAAKALCVSWTQARTHVRQRQYDLFNAYDTVLTNTRNHITHAATALTQRFSDVLARYTRVQQRFVQCIFVYAQAIRARREHIVRVAKYLCTAQKQLLRRAHAHIVTIEKMLMMHNPQRLLARGYAIVRGQRGVVRHVADVYSGEELNVQLSDGTIVVVVSRKR